MYVDAFILLLLFTRAVAHRTAPLISFCARQTARAHMRTFCSTLLFLSLIALLHASSAARCRTPHTCLSCAPRGTSAFAARTTHASTVKGLKEEQDMLHARARAPPHCRAASHLRCINSSFFYASSPLVGLTTHFLHFLHVVCVCSIGGTGTALCLWGMGGSGQMDSGAVSPFHCLFLPPLPHLFTTTTVSANGLLVKWS